jgi:hypothetical protein
MLLPLLLLLLLPLLLLLLLLLLPLLLLLLLLLLRILWCRRVLLLLWLLLLLLLLMMIRVVPRMRRPYLRHIGETGKGRTRRGQWLGRVQKREMGGVGAGSRAQVQGKEEYHAEYGGLPNKGVPPTPTLCLPYGHTRVQGLGLTPIP